jgi:hypothetical protein
MNFVSDKNHSGIDDLVNAAQKSERRAVVNRHNDHTCEDAAPKRDDPLRAVFGPDDDLVTFMNVVFGKSRGEMPCGEAHLRICVLPSAISVIVLKEFDRRLSELSK